MVRIRVVKGPIDTRIKDQLDSFANQFMPSYNIKLPNGLIVTSEDTFIDDIEIEPLATIKNDGEKFQEPLVKELRE